MSYTNHSQLGSLTEVNEKEVLYLFREEDSSGTQMGPRQTKVLEPRCAAVETAQILASDYGSTPQYSRQRYIPLSRVLLRI
jgi:hypothetical protein